MEEEKSKTAQMVVNNEEPEKETNAEEGGKEEEESSDEQSDPMDLTYICDSLSSPDESYQSVSEDENELNSQEESQMNELGKRKRKPV
ncbi:hypothetical protein EVAR_38727_1 [Eumeta japonica]|uniref:Uncharacterized protein n=1 Tax=Eumeta variegata TaxID=151549 RepID=A0A4C1YR95_EUMVA|nr:hypothetical protein EVAR_38727_1 [Eumeta japonica]